MNQMAIFWIMALAQLKLNEFNKPQRRKHVTSAIVVISWALPIFRPITYLGDSVV